MSTYEVNTKHLISALTRVKKLKTKSSLPILDKTVRLVVRDTGTLEIGATNLGTQVYCQVDEYVTAGKHHLVDADFDCVVDLRQLQRCIKAISTDTVSIERIEGGHPKFKDRSQFKLFVRSDNSEFEFRCLNEADGEYPEFEQQSYVGTETTNENMRSVIEKLIPAIYTKDDKRPAMQGLRYNPNKGEMLSTDGHRLERVIDQDLSITDADGDLEHLIVSGESVVLLKKLLRKAKKCQDERVRLSIKTNATGKDEREDPGLISCVVFHEDETVTKIVGKAIDETFPNADRIIQELDGEDRNAFITDRDEFLSAIKRVSVINEGCKLSLGRECSIYSEDTYAGTKATEKLGNCAFEMEQENPFEIGFNCEYLSDIMEVRDEEEVSIMFGSPNRAAYIEANNHLSLLMPVVIN